MNNYISKTRQLVVLSILVLSCFAGTRAIAAPDSEPAKIIEGAVQELIDEFTARRDELENNRPELYAMVDRLTRPHFDFDKISKLVLAQEWKTASEAQRAAFGEEFRNLLIRTYATALFQYTGEEKMVFKGSEIKDRGDIKTAKVSSEVTLSEGPGIPVSYSMILEPDDNWKIYNMNIAGVNMVTSYRKTYSASIRKLGLDGLIDSMHQANTDS